MPIYWKKGKNLSKIRKEEIFLQRFSIIMLPFLTKSLSVQLLSKERGCQEPATKVAGVTKAGS